MVDYLTDAGCWIQCVGIDDVLVRRVIISY